VGKVRVIDFGSQFSRLIVRLIRELHVYAEIYPWWNAFAEWDEEITAVILSGGPNSVMEPDAPRIQLQRLETYPVLGICYGAQLIAYHYGGRLGQATHREYGATELEVVADTPLFHGIPKRFQVWMSHGDHIHELPSSFRLLGKTRTIEVAAFQGPFPNWYAVQFHPEVHHSEYGATLMENFLFRIAGCKPLWTSARFIEQKVEAIRSQMDEKAEAICAVSGGVDSSVAAALVSKAIGKRLHCIFVNTGLLRKNEFEEVFRIYRDIGLNVKGIDAKAQFLNRLKGVTDPEKKRKIIGETFIEVFEKEAEQYPHVRYLVQGTIYPDVIESAQSESGAHLIKSHHNVGGLPQKMKLTLIEPLRELFKDEVRRVGAELGLPPHLLNRHPFPGPGLAIRIIGEVTEERIRMLQEADAIFLQWLRDWNLYEQVWQAFSVLLPVKSVGVMGDQRTYEHVLCLRAVTSRDGMTADWARLPHDFLAQVSNAIVNQVKGINRVVYDISSKPPSTIEWE